MGIVIADTSPINYLLRIGHIDILHVLFDRVLLPAVVAVELRHPKAPLVVRKWIDAPPAWVDIQPTPAVTSQDFALRRLDAGEADAIALALELSAELVLMDDEEGVAAARSRGLEVIGTLGVLGRAAGRNLIDLADAFERVKRTNFRYRQEIMNQFLAENALR